MSDAVNLPELLVLASASPRRRELLAQMGVNFQVQVADIDEIPAPGEAPEDYVQRMAQEKAVNVITRLQRTGSASAVLGADTIVVAQGRVLGKPQNRQDALRMLQLLSGRPHEVFSAVTVGRNSRLEAVLSRTVVVFRKLDDVEMLAYWRSGEPSGKAGAYAIQGLGGMFVERLEGSYTGVVGLPVFETAALLGRCGVPTGLQAVAIQHQENVDE